MSNRLDSAENGTARKEEPIKCMHVVFFCSLLLAAPEPRTCVLVLQRKTRIEESRWRIGVRTFFALFNGNYSISKTETLRGRKNLPVS